MAVELHRGPFLDGKAPEKEIQQRQLQFTIEQSLRLGRKVNRKRQSRHTVMAAHVAFGGGHRAPDKLDEETRALTQVDQKATIQVSEDDGQPIFSPYISDMFREVLEAAIILSVLLALIEQIVKPLDQNSPTGTRDQLSIETPRLPRLEENLNQSHLELESLASGHAAYQHPIGKDNEAYRDKIIKRMRLQVTESFLRFSQEHLPACFVPCVLVLILSGLLHQTYRHLWERRGTLGGHFLIDRIRDDIRYGYHHDANRPIENQMAHQNYPRHLSKKTLSMAMVMVRKHSQNFGGWYPLVFIGGVSLGQPAASIPIAAVTGIMLDSVGGDAAEAGDGPGSFPVDGYIWHLDYGALINFVGCIQNQKKLIAPCFLTVGTHTGSILTVMIYISFWLIASATLIFMKWHEGRCTIFNVSSSARKQRLARLNGTGEGNQHDYDRD
ncbi:hypothetical protein KEM48_006987 [Puccinia striiformis f. sp. tritici PST-130]|nr:hypothetical protein KEM48_006987 [Puccinia striiformis f. sp. tritici PST-130]